MRTSTRDWPRPVYDTGKVVEHWDVLQLIPDDCRNDNGLFGASHARTRWQGTDLIRHLLSAPLAENDLIGPDKAQNRPGLLVQQIKIQIAV